MKKQIKSILSVSLSAMELHSYSKIDISIDLILDVRDDSGESDSTIFDDSSPTMEGSQLILLLAWRYFIKVRSPHLHGGPSLLCPPILLHTRGTRMSYRSPNQMGVWSLFRWSS